MNIKNMFKKSFTILLCGFLILTTLLTKEELSAKEKKEKIKKEYNLSEEAIVIMISDGIQAIYDIQADKYKKEIEYEIRRNGYSFERAYGFAGLFINKLSKLGSEIPLEKRRFYWECVHVTLIEKLRGYFSESNVSHLWPKVEEYITNECRVNSVFG